jgi:competence protein ComEC
VDVLQIGHHGSETSRSAPFIAKVQPKIAVISAGVAFEGTNDGICHPRKKTIEALTAAMGGAGGKIVHSFDGKHSCKKKTNTPAQWVNVAAADSILVTSRDGWINLTTTGNGQFSVATEK